MEKGRRREEAVGKGPGRRCRSRRTRTQVGERRGRGVSEEERKDKLLRKQGWVRMVYVCFLCSYDRIYVVFGPGGDRNMGRKRVHVLYNLRVA